MIINYSWRGKHVLTPLILVLCLILPHFSIAFAQEFRYDSHGRRDPFLPPGAGGESGAVGGVRLEGIVFDPKGGSMAIVNGQMVREGEMVNGLILKRLGENRAFFEREREGEKEELEVVLNEDNELIKQYLEGKKVNELLSGADNKEDMTEGSST